jgi:SWI/SNF-related matrix-associated actin-dependent regulator of chromatin subfamily A3
MNSSSGETGAEEDKESDKCQLFIMTAKMVGKRHYSGAMNDKEMVYLVREPSNPYDRNAIKVESINHQQGDN